MTTHADPFAADAQGAPVHDKAVTLPNGSVFTGWSHLARRSEPLEIMLHHGLGSLPYGVAYWFWHKASPPHFFLWSGRNPRPNEAGPVQIFTTPNYVYFHFEANKPFFSRFNEGDGSFAPIYEGWIGALVTPA